ncbi:MAG: hypothetical protein ABR884_00595 [Minisyncoccia bacterium]|jgi:hypothetical protein
MTGVGRKVFGERTPVRIIFEGAPEEKRNGGFYVVDDFLLPAKMVKKLFVPGGFILTPDCSVAENSVLNEKNEECVMIKGGDPRHGAATEALIPRRLLYKVVEPPREAYPQKW